MKRVLLSIFIIVTGVYGYDFYDHNDSKNVYFESEHFRVIAGVDYKDDNFVRDFASKSLDAAELSWDKLITNYQFKEPNHQNKLIDIYVASLHYDSSYDYGGYYTDDGSKVTISSSYAGLATYYEDKRPLFILNPKMTQKQLNVTISHEFTHTIHYSYTDFDAVSNAKWLASVWWLEATATLMEDEVYDDINDYKIFLDPFFNGSYKNIELYDGSHEYAMVLFAKFLKEKYGLEIIKKSFEQFDSYDSKGFYEVIDEILQNDYNSSIQFALNIFAKWVANPSKYFEEGSSYPKLKRYNISDNITLQKGGIVVYDSLKYGWNLTTLSTQKLQDIDINDTSYIWTYQDGIWFNNIGNDSYRDINITSISKAYWIYAKGDTSNYYTYYDISDELDYQSLDNGWNFLGTSKDIDLSSLESFKIVWVYENSTWKAYSSDANIMQKINDDYETITKIYKYSGFWVLK